MKYRWMLMAMAACAALPGFAQHKVKKQNKAIVETVVEAAPVAEIVVDTTPAKPEPPKDRIDTLYYDKDWQVVGNKGFASFYRIALYPVDTQARKRMRTFYVDGKLESEGFFLSLDKYDDSQSQFEGKFIEYYPSGNVSKTCFYKNGKLQGEWITFFENGLVHEHTNMNEGEKDGIYSSFTENGDVCKQTLYKNGAESDLYILTDKAGNFSKYTTANDKPIYEKPNLSEIKTEYKKGVAWPYYNINGLIVGVSNTLVESLDDFRAIQVIVSNNSMNNVDIDPAAIEAYTVKKGNKKPLEFVPFDEYDEKIYKKKKKEIKATIKQKAVVHVEQENYTASNLGASALKDGGSNTVKDFQKRMMKRKDLTNDNTYVEMDNRLEDMGYLLRTTVHPGEIVSGFLYTDDRKVDEVYVNVTINGVTYPYKWVEMKKK